MKKLDVFLSKNLPDQEWNFYKDVVKKLSVGQKKELIDLLISCNKDNRLLMERLDSNLMDFICLNVITARKVTLFKYTISVLPKHPYLARHMKNHLKRYYL